MLSADILNFKTWVNFILHVLAQHSFTLAFYFQWNFEKVKLVVSGAVEFVPWSVASRVGVHLVSSWRFLQEQPNPATASSSDIQFPTATHLLHNHQLPNFYQIRRIEIVPLQKNWD